jgi:hypothetical protein
MTAPSRYRCSCIRRASAAAEVSKTPDGDDVAEAKRKQWREFEKEVTVLHRYGTSGLRRLGPDPLVRLIKGYHRLAGDLARARAIGRNSALVHHLNAIAIRAHNILYGHIKVAKPGSDVYWGYRFPIAVRRHLPAMAVSAMVSSSPREKIPFTPFPRWPGPWLHRESSATTFR